MTTQIVASKELKELSHDSFESSYPDQSSEENYKDFVEYTCQRIEYLESVLKRNGKFYGPSLQVGFTDLEKELPFLREFLWPHITLNYKGGLVLSWASDTTEVSIEISRAARWPITIMDLPKPLSPDSEFEWVDFPKGAFTLQFIYALNKIQERILECNPNWKTDMREQIKL